jgi:hypothetical protein
MQEYSEMRCIIGSIGYRINVNRQNLLPHSFSKLSNFLKILRFLSKSRVTEIFTISATKATTETIPDVAPNRRFRVAENFLLGRMDETEIRTAYFQYSEYRYFTCRSSAAFAFPDAAKYDSSNSISPAKSAYSSTFS